MPKVSVIVPVYNVEKYLNRCIDSILNQTFHDFELILVDDGSTDESGAICDKYKQMDERVITIHKSNAGVSAARNTGLDAASGDYIMFVDSDDYIDSEMLAALESRMDNDVDLVISSIKMITKIKEQNFIIPNGAHDSRKLMEMYAFEQFPQICLCGPWCKLYRNQVIKSKNIKFDEELFLGEDTCFNVQYLSYCRGIVTMKDIFYFYMRDNEESLFTKFRDYYYKNSRKVYEITDAVMQQLACSEGAQCEQKKRYVFGCVANLYKAVQTADRNICIGYIKEIATDPELRKHREVLRKKKSYYAIVKLIQLKCYHLGYLGVWLWCICRKK